MDSNQFPKELGGANECDSWPKDRQVQNEHQNTLRISRRTYAWSSRSRNRNSFLEKTQRKKPTLVQEEREVRHENLHSYWRRLGLHQPIGVLSSGKQNETIFVPISFKLLRSIYGQTNELRWLVQRPWEIYGQPAGEMEDSIKSEKRPSWLQPERRTLQGLGLSGRRCQNTLLKETYQLQSFALWQDFSVRPCKRGHLLNLELWKPKVASVYAGYGRVHALSGHHCHYKSYWRRRSWSLYQNALEG